jgi:hypothetical protein
MTVSPAGPQASARQIVGIPDGPSHDTDASTDLSFAQILWPPSDGQPQDLDNLDTGEMPTVESETPAGAVFHAGETVADNAIRFDGKPIVAPSKVEAGAEDIDPRSADTWMRPVAVQPTVPAPHSLEISWELPILPTSVVRQNGVAARATAPTAPPEVRPSEPRAPSQARPAGFPVESADETGAAAPRRAIQGIASGAHRFAASIALLSGEVVVTVRGVRLSESEREALLGDVRELLAEHGLENRPIRILAGPRRVS